ncbi:conserved hypothetical protein [Leishmania braziliensis MHOM/BR/75/M2904]|uniref:Uncharacterized protein n=2 Tax=Leishmania braziliensis TaxID=5660 RepID=A4HMS8_LEIBR|nr:conserved hypothetical protein [Leishmania braziliensis MHOM/BR/75/M2904]KAI5689324.1 hypothetical protein MNV84_07474 [Leishmania braziliensis]CAJ2480351.1 unnamed protein product [Leishmania braziliensis]CAJ2480792.1 unnamed protein product [Leishmania braziliensis]CAM43467.1 conserved hypothetical protein [Leishmania braziliensis MHOM/BR/75/M2904]SYZ69540.1 hypothetical_protein [Leishmania braziliensis MHOM/BR/75/M2904]
MSSDDIDALRSELLRQKIIFEAELRRQREMFEERLSIISNELADREADCLNLQSVITILGRKVDAIAEQREHITVAHRPLTPARQPSIHESPFRRNPSTLVPRPGSNGKPQERPRANSTVTPSGIRRPSPSFNDPPTSLHRSGMSITRVASLSTLSRTNSPLVRGHPVRPLLRTNTSATLTSDVNSSCGKRVPRRRTVSRRRTSSVSHVAGITRTNGL